MVELTLRLLAFASHEPPISVSLEKQGSFLTHLLIIYLIFCDQIFHFSTFVILLSEFFQIGYKCEIISVMKCKSYELTFSVIGLVQETSTCALNSIQLLHIAFNPM